MILSPRGVDVEVEVDVDADGDSAKPLAVGTGVVVAAVTGMVSKLVVGLLLPPDLDALLDTLERSVEALLFIFDLTDFEEDGVPVREGGRTVKSAAVSSPDFLVSSWTSCSEFFYVASLLLLLLLYPAMS